MKSQLVMRTLLASALVMTFVACGQAKKGGAVRGRSGKGTAQTQPQNTTTTDADADTQTDPTENQEGEVVVDPTVSNDNAETADTTETSDDDTQTGNSSTGETQKPTTEAQPKEQIQVSTDEFERMLRSSTRYSGAAKDSLRQMLQTKMQSIDDSAAKMLNLKTANTISDATLIVDQEFKEIAVKFTQNIDGKSRVTELQGTLNGNLVADVQKSRGPVGAEGKVSCMDKAAKSCSVAHARILVGDNQGSRAVVNIIFRKTGADLRVSPKKDDQTKITEKEELLAFLGGKKQEKIDSSRIVMESFEVIQGASAARLSIYSTKNELITMKTPLLNFDVVGSPIVFVNTSLKGIDMVDLKTAQPLKSTYQSMIQEARLVKNFNNGNIAIQLMVGPKDNSDSAQLTIEVARRQVEIKTGQSLDNE